MKEIVIKNTDIPINWDQVKFSQYCRIIKNKDSDLIEFISIFTGVDYDTVKKAKISQQDLWRIEGYSSFLRQVPNIEPIPKQLGNYKLPKDPDYTTTEQFENARQVIEKIKQNDNDSLLDAYAKLTAIYYQYLRDGEYDGEKAMSLVTEINNFPCLEVMSAGRFFISLRISSWSGTTLSSLIPGLPLRRRRQDLINSVRRSRSMQRLTTWLTGMLPNTVKS